MKARIESLTAQDKGRMLVCFMLTMFVAGLLYGVFVMGLR